MEGLFRLLWSSSSAKSLAVDIPTYRQGEAEDPVDLQIKSLMYMFRRCNIASADQFRSPAETASTKQRPKRPTTDMKVLSETSKSALNKYSADGLRGLTPAEKQKLDVMYSKPQFEKVLARDEHRVLIDWSKNKFRAMCILSGKPQELSVLPSFDAPNFHFIVLPAGTSDDEYIKVLSCSDLYIEHSVTLAHRQKLVKELLFAYRASKARTGPFTKADRAFIIHKYLCALAVEVQVERLYRATLRAKKQQRFHEASPGSPPRSPSPISPDRASKQPKLGPPPKMRLSAQPSLSNLVSPGSHGGSHGGSQPHVSSGRSSPTRSPRNSGGKSPVSRPSAPPSPVRPLRGKTSTPNLSSFASTAVPNLGPGSSTGSTVTKLADDPVPPAIQREIMEQARFAVKARIERERALLA